jgi:glutamine amidotransferase
MLDTMSSIGIIDVGIGNVKSIENVLTREGFPCEKITEVKNLKNFNKIILPGVGAFDAGMQKLNSSGFSSEIKILASQSTLFLGICLGAELLMAKSAEGELEGLNLIKGEVKAFKPNPIFKIPHMGWNTLTEMKEDQILFNVKKDERFYFSHGYFMQCENQNNSIAKTKYEFSFDAIIKDKNLYGVQFHPEKSHKQGIQILRNFAQINV